MVAESTSSVSSLFSGRHNAACTRPGRCALPQARLVSVASAPYSPGATRSSSSVSAPPNTAATGPPSSMSPAPVATVLWTASGQAKQLYGCGRARWSSCRPWSPPSATPSPETSRSPLSPALPMAWRRRRPSLSSLSLSDG
jgi:hypothetical protein